MSLKFEKTKYTGVFFRVTIDNEKIFYIRYKKNGKSITEKIGSSKKI